MPTFRTIFPGHSSGLRIHHEHSLFLIGSCFSTHIGKKLDNSGFRINSNPLGILFNPGSIQLALQRIMSNHKITDDDLFFHEGLWRSFLFHSSLASTSKDECIYHANQIITDSHTFLKNAEFLFITFGTAWVYEYNHNGLIVANCHKLSAAQFTKRKMGVNEIVSDQSLLIERLREFNPSLKIVFTISPVRHLADGFVENSWSKATLNVALHELVRRYEHAAYFPSYEIVMDDLRDYRFYDEDMIHTSAQAHEYVWEHFCKAYFTPETLNLAARFQSLEKMLLHKPLHPDAETLQDFVQKGISQTVELKQINPVKAKEIQQRFEEKLRNTSC
jgi:hypothetical protein